MKKRWHKTTKKGIRYAMVRKKGHDYKYEKMYYATFWNGTKTITVKMGRESEGMNESRAYHQMILMMEGKSKPPQTKRQLEIEKARREAERRKSEYTLTKIWESYRLSKGIYPSLQNDIPNFEHRILAYWGDIHPREITTKRLMDFKIWLNGQYIVNPGTNAMLRAALKIGDHKKAELARKRMEENKKPLSLQTQRHVLTLLRRLINFAIENELIKPQVIKWNIHKIDNKIDEFLTEKQIGELIDACWKFPHPVAGLLVLVALYTGLRRNHILTLTWDRVDLEAGIIWPKKTSAIKNVDITPLSREAIEVFKKVPKISNKWVFGSPVTKSHYHDGGLRKQLSKLKKQLNLPKKFRMLHGMRHIYGSRVTELGGIYAAKGLLHHKDAATTERYAKWDLDIYAQVNQAAAESFGGHDKQKSKSAEIIRLPKG